MNLRSDQGRVLASAIDYVVFQWGLDSTAYFLLHPKNSLIFSFVFLGLYQLFLRNPLETLFFLRSKHKIAAYDLMFLR